MTNEAEWGEDFDEVIAGTLEWCNKVRTGKGLAPLPDLPKGKKDEPLTCPCGAATGYWVDKDVYAISREAWDGGMHWPLPGPVIEFVHAFDGGQLPQYEVPSHREETFIHDEA